MELVYIFWTTGSIDEARRVSRFLVQEKHVACANIIPWVESVFNWEDKICTEQETKVIFKTTKDKFATVRDAILNNCKYDCPEISMLAIAESHAPFKDWVAATCK